MEDICQNKELLNILNEYRNHNYSRPLDVHLTTNHPEIKGLVDFIFAKYFNTRKKVIIKKHLKVLLLDLYVAWNTDPKLEIGVHMSPNSYTLAKRYNQLYITRTIIDVVTVLRNHNVIGFHKGFVRELEGAYQAMWKKWCSS